MALMKEASLVMMMGLATDVALVGMALMESTLTLSAGRMRICPPLPFLSSLLTLLLPVARDGTSQDGTDEGGIVGDDGGAGSRRDVTGGDHTDDRINTSTERKEDEDDHTPYPSQSSEHAVCMDMYEIAILCGMCPHTTSVKLVTLCCVCVLQLMYMYTA